MVKLLILIGVVLVLAAFLWWMRSSRESAPAQVEEEENKYRVKPEEQSDWGICKGCGEQRVIIRKDAGLCAFCWSTSQTKPLA